MPNIACLNHINITDIVKDPQIGIDRIVKQQNPITDKKKKKTPYMCTPEYYWFLQYYYQLPWCIYQAMHFGEFSLIGIGNPDSNLVEQMQNYSQAYLDLHFPEQEYIARIIPIEFLKCPNTSIYKTVMPYRLSVHNYEKIN